MIVVAIIGTIIGVAIPVYSDRVDKAKITAAIVEVRGLEREIQRFEADNNALPDSLNDVGSGGMLDPWGNPYQYKRLTGAMNEKPRKDRFLVPVNTDFDLYSMGADGRSVAPFTAQMSRDDIVRAADGAFVGLAVEF
jgi:general secretion pathway protein G